MRSIEEDKKKTLSKKQKVSGEARISKFGPKSLALKKLKSSEVGRADKKTVAPSEQVLETPSASSIGVTKILEVMTQPLPFAMLGPLGSDLTSLLHPRGKILGKIPEREMCPWAISIIFW